jgi:hypothetical protein
MRKSVMKWHRRAWRYVKLREKHPEAAAEFRRRFKGQKFDRALARAT